MQVGIRVESAESITKAVSGKKPSFNDLDGNFSFVISAVTEFYAWIGSKSSQESRSMAVEHAKKLASQRKHWTTFKRVIQNAEPVLFHEKFADWPDSIRLARVKEVKGNVAETKVEDYDVSKMYDDTRKEEDLHDGSGTVQKWRIHAFDKEEVDPSQHHIFFSEESYIILYTYIKKNKNAWIMYFWQGVASTIVRQCEQVAAY